MDKLRTWFTIYNTQITWFIVGMLFETCLDHLSRGQFGQAMLDVFLAALNIYFWRAKHD